MQVWRWKGRTTTKPTFLFELRSNDPSLDMTLVTLKASKKRNVTRLSICWHFLDVRNERLIILSLAWHECNLQLDTDTNANFYMYIQYLHVCGLQFVNAHVGQIANIRRYICTWYRSVHEKFILYKLISSSRQQETAVTTTKYICIGIWLFYNFHMIMQID